MDPSSSHRGCPRFKSSVEEPHLFCHQPNPPLPVGKFWSRHHPRNTSAISRTWHCSLRAACASSVNKAVAQKVWEPISVLKIIYYFFSLTEFPDLQLSWLYTPPIMEYDILYINSQRQNFGPPGETSSSNLDIHYTANLLLAAGTVADSQISCSVRRTPALSLGQL